jgi:4-hydroxy-3-methylbut-2-enyl diphosphate reductase IspH
VALCKLGCDLVVVVGGFGSSNTRHLYELARSYAPAWFIEDARAIRSPRELETVDLPAGRPVVAENWLPPRRPLRIGVLAGASSPEIVVGEVVQRLGEFLG